MPTDHDQHNDHHDPVDDRSPEELRKMAYEDRDIDMSQINKSVVAFFAFTVVSIAASAGFYLWAAGHIGPQPEPPTRTLRLAPKDAPYVQGNVTAKKDIKVLRKEENELISTYGWVDKNKGVVRLPIDQAMALVLERGLPVRPGAPTLEDARKNMGSAVPAPSSIDTTKTGSPAEGVSEPQ
ncbi:MAG TPA: hypothetical protein PLH94_01185 [Fimbriimonadaceae bacterium]|nr:hypothetical protein [Fimbriimonadaceae bacterium]